MAQKNRLGAWSGLDIPVHQTAAALFDISVTTHIGKGTTTWFLFDKWLFGCSLQELAPTVVMAVPLQIRQQRTVAEAFLERRWPSDIRAGLSLVGLCKYFQLWDALLEVELTEEPDQHIWQWESSGSYSSKSAYRAFFNGAITVEPLAEAMEIMGPS